MPGFELTLVVLCKRFKRLSNCDQLFEQNRLWNQTVRQISLDTWYKKSNLLHLHSFHWAWREQYYSKFRHVVAKPHGVKSQGTVNLVVEFYWLFKKFLPFYCCRLCFRISNCLEIREGNYRRTCTSREKQLSPSLCLSARPSVCPHLSVQHPLYGYSRNFVLGSLRNICRGSANFFKIVQNYWALHVKTWVPLHCWQKYEIYSIVKGANCCIFIATLNNFTLFTATCVGRAA